MGRGSRGRRNQVISAQGLGAGVLGHPKLALGCHQVPQPCLPEPADPLRPLVVAPRQGVQTWRSLPTPGPAPEDPGCLLLLVRTLHAAPSGSLGTEGGRAPPRRGAPVSGVGWTRSGRDGEGCREGPSERRPACLPQGLSGCQARLWAALPPPGVGLPAAQRPLCALSPLPPRWQYPDKHPPPGGTGLKFQPSGPLPRLGVWARQLRTSPRTCPERSVHLAAPQLHGSPGPHPMGTRTPPPLPHVVDSGPL